LLAGHSLFDLAVKAEGDLQVDGHHTVEDVGLCFGQALAQALGDKAGSRRYGDCTLPMDEALATAAIDLSGRPCLVWSAEIPKTRLQDAAGESAQAAANGFDAELAEEFWRAVANEAKLGLHVVLHHGRNTHHMLEAIFKACARALRQATEMDPRR